MRRIILSLSLLIFVLISGARMSYAQGVQTGTLTGVVKTQDLAVLAEALVRVSSAALQGERSTSTDLNGVFVLPGLPPGDYAVRIEKTGLASAEMRVTIPLGSTASINAALEVAPLVESVVVQGTVPTTVTEIQTSANLPARSINVLPVGRTPYLLSELMLGVTTNAPSPNQITISGGFAFDNVFLIDGVDVNDNLLGTANDLFIEDAIGEVQVLSSTIGAEYGRFSGGVVNIISKTGGNQFSGSYRTTFGNPSWTRETPYEDANSIERVDKLSSYSELTIGGPAVRDRLWFFGAGRFESSSSAGTLPQTAAPYTKTNRGRRYEGKLTATAHTGHTLQGSFLANRVNRGNEPVLSFTIDPAAMISPSTPNDLAVVSYNGVLSPRLLATMQFSRKGFATEGVGGTSTNIIDSPFLTRTGTQYQYNAPYFDASDPEQRDNRQVTASVSYFATRPRMGSHEIKAGFENFVDTRTGANAQSSTGYVFMSNFKASAAGVPLLDADGHLIPVFTPGVSRVQRWIPHRGAEFNLATVSTYLQDRWVATPRLTLNLGIRFEHASSDDSTGVNAVGAARAVPRVGASYDLDGAGRTIAQASFSRYSGKYNAAQFSKNTNVGNSDRYTTVYMGPAGEGRSFAPGFAVGNYAGVVAGTFPALNVRFDEDLSSPIATEYSVALGRQFGSRSFAKLIFVDRHTTGFVEDFIQHDQGTSPIVIDGATVASLDNIVYANSSVPSREYRALEIVGQHELPGRVTLNGYWALQLKNNGNFEGETPNPAGSPVGDYPEMLSLDRSAPEGRLDDFQRSKIRVWADYELALGPLGSVTVAPVYRYNSGRTYSLAATGVALSATQLARNPGYAGTPTQTLFFGERGSESFEGYALMDLAVSYDVPVWRTFKPWVKLEVFNLLNNRKLIAWDTSVAPDPASALDADGLPTGYLKGARFGQPTMTGHYAGPRAGETGGRMFDFAVGFRF